MNLLKETQKAVELSGHYVKDVLWVGSRDGRYTCSWDEFCLLANEEYNNSYGYEEVGTDLVVVFGDNSWLERESEDGGEWWKLKKCPSQSTDTKKLKSPFTWVHTMTKCDSCGEPTSETKQIRVLGKEMDVCEKCYKRINDEIWERQHI